MSKPKFPKKSNGVKESAFVTNTPPPISDTKVGPVEPVVAALSGAEPGKTETKKAEVKKAARKPEIVKAEPRANLVPINLEDEIRRLAYLLSERRGFEAGHETEDWVNAEREIRQRYHQHSA
jgi:hypothetical protein